MIIYIDDDFKCHISNDGTMREVETAHFDGKCQKFIEGCRYIPNGDIWVAEDGTEIFGEASLPWREYSMLEEFQAQYEEQQEQLNSILAQIEAALGVVE